MICEMCGRPIKGEPIVAKVEGAVMELCSSCAKYGEKISSKKTPLQVQHKPALKKPGTAAPKGYPAPKKRYDMFEDQMVVTPDIGVIVRNYRINLGLTQKELATKTNIASPVINRIESGKFVPPLETARKLEKVMNTTLVTKREDFIPQKKDSPLESPTLGDVVKIKKKS